MSIIHLDVEIKIALRGAGLRAGGITGARRQRQRPGRDAPIIAVAVEQRLASQRINVQISAVGIEVPACIRFAKHALRLRRQRIGDGACARQQRFLLRISKCRLELARVLAAGPRQDERGERDDQQLKADAHSTQR